MTKNHWRDEDDRDNRRSRRSSTRDYARDTDQQENDNVSYSDRSYSGQRRGGSPYEPYAGQSGYGRQENYGQGSYENRGQNQGQSYGPSYGRGNYAGNYTQDSYGQQGYGGYSGVQQGPGYHQQQYGQAPYSQQQYGQPQYGQAYEQGGYGSAQEPSSQGRSEWSSYGQGGRNAGSEPWGSNYGARNYGAGSYGGGRGGYGNYGRTYGGSYSNSYGTNNYGRDRWDRDMNENNRGFFERAADEVSSWFGNEDAEMRRQADKYRGRGPKNYTRSDDRIREDVCDRLAADPWIDASEIEVSVNGAEVTLSGQVASRDQRRRIEDCAENVSGVSHVQNNTRVNRDYSSASYGASLGSSTTGNGSKSSGSTKGMAGSTTGSTSTPGRLSS